MEDKLAVGMIVVLAASIGIFGFMMMSPLVMSNSGFFGHHGMMMDNDIYEDSDYCSINHSHSFEECEQTYDECEEEYHEQSCENEESFTCPMD